MTQSIERVKKRQTPQMIPQSLHGEPGLVQVDATWGTLQPMQVAEGVRTVGELEVMAYLEQELSVVDSRTKDFYDNSTIPGAHGTTHVTKLHDHSDYSIWMGRRLSSGQVEAPLSCTTLFALCPKACYNTRIDRKKASRL